MSNHVLCQSLEYCLSSKIFVVSRVKGKTLFEMAESEPILGYVCDFYLNIVDQLLVNPEGVIPHELGDRELF